MSIPKQPRVVDDTSDDEIMQAYFGRISRIEDRIESLGNVVNDADARGSHPKGTFAAARKLFISALGDVRLIEAEIESIIHWLSKEENRKPLAAALKARGPD